MPQMNLVIKLAYDVGKCGQHATAFIINLKRETQCHRYSLICKLSERTDN